MDCIASVAASGHETEHGTTSASGGKDITSSALTDQDG